MNGIALGWRIEQLFATLKQAGLNLLATQLESVEAIQRLTVLGLSVAVRTLQLLEGRDNPAISAAVAFNDEQQQCLDQLVPTLQGRTSITVQSLSSRFFTLGNLAHCSFRRMVGLSLPASTWNAYKECRVCGSLSLSSLDGNWLRIHLCVHGSRRYGSLQQSPPTVVRASYYNAWCLRPPIRTTSTAPAAMVWSPGARLSWVLMSDSAANQAEYPQHGNQTEGCGFPIAKLVVIFSLLTGGCGGGRLYRALGNQ